MQSKAATRLVFDGGLESERPLSSKAAARMI